MCQAGIGVRPAWGETSVAVRYINYSLHHYLSNTSSKVRQWSANLFDQFEEVLAWGPPIGFALAFRSPIEQLDGRQLFEIAASAACGVAGRGGDVSRGPRDGVEEGRVGGG